MKLLACGDLAAPSEGRTRPDAALRGNNGPVRPFETLRTSCSPRRRPAPPRSPGLWVLALRGEPPPDLRLLPQLGDAEEIVGQHRQPDEHLEPVAPLEPAAFHAAPTAEDRDAALDARAEALPALEGPAPLVGRALRRLGPAPLGEADPCDPGRGQRLLVGRAGEPAIARVEGRRPAERAHEG